MQVTVAGINHDHSLQSLSFGEINVASRGDLNFTWCFGQSGHLRNTTSKDINALLTYRLTKAQIPL